MARPTRIVWGIGGGVTFPALFVAAGSGVPPALQGLASALATSAQQVGGAVGLAAVVAVVAAGTVNADSARWGALVMVGFAVLATVCVAALPRPTSHPTRDAGVEAGIR